VPSTDDETLTRLLEILDPDLHRLSDSQERARQFCQHVSEYRRFDKLDGTYAGKIVELADAESRIYTTIKQTRAASGRLTSGEPFNFQNFPSRDPEEAKVFRKGFVPRPGYSILKLDFSQIELRMAAHNSQDPAMMQRFIDDEDLHAATASMINNVPIEKVTKDQRSASKTVGFGALYGLTDRGLVPKLPPENRNLEYAAWFLQRFWQVYPDVTKEVARVHNWIRRYKWVADPWGRVRMIPEAESRIERVIAEGLREGFNHTIQGGAQGIIKIPMGRTLDLIRDWGLDCVPLIQIHDEMDFEVWTPQLQDAAECFGGAYAQATALDVPVKVEVEAGDNWGEMEKILSVSAFEGRVEFEAAH
jgi:DNA polymerase-1